MKNEARTILLGTLFILVFGIFSHVVMTRSMEDRKETFAGSWACTADTQICSDGSEVSRIPPYCQFASC